MKKTKLTGPQEERELLRQADAQRTWVVIYHEAGETKFHGPYNFRDAVYVSNRLNKNKSIGNVRLLTTPEFDGFMASYQE